MQTYHKILHLGLLAALCSPAAAQQPTKQSGRSATPMIISEELLELLPLHPQHLSVQEVHRIGYELFGRRFTLARIGGTRSNLLIANSALLIHDTKDRAKKIHAKLTELDAMAAHQQRPSVELETVVLPLEHISAQDALNALSSYRRTVQLMENGQPTRVNSIATSRQANALVIRDLGKNIAAIRKVLTQIDLERPAAQNLMLQAMVIQGSKEAGGPIPVPAELKAGLSRLVPYQAFKTLGIGIVNCKVLENSDSSITVDLGNGSNCELRLDGMSIDGDGLDIHALHCRLLMRKPLDPKRPKGPAAAAGQELKTSLRASLNGYTVVGAMGQDPVFIVLRVSRSSLR